ncbi:MAG TPA: tetratricopeptide repeat protein [Verrucomicrobiae bacterium]|nr:tetratricopeptide repeat protein [Verrucomicrobiae bacterium]
MNIFKEFSNWCASKKHPTEETDKSCAQPVDFSNWCASKNHATVEAEKSCAQPVDASTARAHILSKRQPQPTISANMRRAMAVVYRDPFDETLNSLFFKPSEHIGHPDIAILMLKERDVIPECVKQLYDAPQGTGSKHLANNPWKAFLSETRLVNGGNRPYGSDFLGYRLLFDDANNKIFFDLTSYITMFQVSPEGRSALEKMDRRFPVNAVAFVKARLPTGMIMEFSEDAAFKAVVGGHADVDVLSALAMSSMGTGDFSVAIAAYSSLIETAGLSIDEKAGDLLNRAVCYGEIQQTQRELDDYAHILAMPGISSEVKCQALANRSAAWLRLGEWEKAIDDGKEAAAQANNPIGLYTSLLNQGMAFCESGQHDKAICAYTSLLSIPGIPDQQRAEAMLERGATCLACSRYKEASADFSTVIEMRAATGQQKACGFCYRAFCLSRAGRRAEAVTDAKVAINSPELPAKLRDMAEHILKISQ